MITKGKESKRPPDGDFYQQRMKAWQPIMTPRWVIGTFFSVGIVFVIAGIIFVGYSNKVVEKSFQYDGEGTTFTDCMLPKPVGGNKSVKDCTITIKIDENMASPVFVYYELHNFYQNHRRYVKSRNDKQLMGEIVDNATLISTCDAKAQDPDTKKFYNPCGLIANSMFNDIITIAPDTQAGPVLKGKKMKESDIAWPSDRTDKFKNPAGAAYGAPGYIWLYDTYKGIVEKDAVTNDTDNANYYGGGVQNEHFIVWMRTAALSTFRKLYGKIEVDLPKNMELKFNIKSQFNVDEFKGKKFIVISTTSWLGGKNPFLGYAYISVGALALVLAFVFLLKQLIAPRELGDTKFLVWKTK